MLYFVLFAYKDMQLKQQIFICLKGVSCKAETYNETSQDLLPAYLFYYIYNDVQETRL